ncbi:hypothetical protein BC629DRAFT_1455474 [Irpex lacteus]|nr:hypothetical protein BC629DRAFT_1455474 [Irpex lacteus]
MSAGGLSRRRHTSPSSQAPSPSVSTANIAHAGSAFAGGSKIAYDPRDLINQGEEDAKQGGKAPRCAAGIKDKQVRLVPHWQLYVHSHFPCMWRLGIPFILER